MIKEGLRFSCPFCVLSGYVDIQNKFIQIYETFASK